LQWLGYERLREANQAYRFTHADIVLTQPPFNSISTQIRVDKWLPDGPQDIIKDPAPIALYDTIRLTLQPLSTGSQCSPSNIVSYEVLADAPGFTIDRIGDALRPRAAVLAPACSLAAKAPPAAAPWRWNLMAIQPGNHVVTLLLLALDKNHNVVDSREADIPLFVPSAPQSFAANVGLVSVFITIVTALIGLWERFRPKPGQPESR
jgi:hypothetical protein